MNSVSHILKHKLLITNNDIHIVDNIMGYLTDKCENCDKVCFVEDLKHNFCKKCTGYIDKYFKYSDQRLFLLEVYNSFARQQFDLLTSDNLDEETILRTEYLDHDLQLVAKKCRICKTVCEQIKRDHLPCMAVWDKKLNIKKT